MFKYLFLLYFLYTSIQAVQAQNWLYKHNRFCPEKPKFIQTINKDDWCKIYFSLQNSIQNTGLGSKLGQENALYIMLGLIQKESSFRIDVKGKAGEIGLTQIKPDTARFVCKIDEKDLFEIEKNIQCSAYYLNMLLSENYFKSDLFLALIAYNKGWGNVKKGLFTEKDAKYARLIIDEYSLNLKKELF